MDEGGWTGKVAQSARLGLVFVLVGDANRHSRGRLVVVLMSDRLVRVSYFSYYTSILIIVGTAADCEPQICSSHHERRRYVRCSLPYTKSFS